MAEHGGDEGSTTEQSAIRQAAAMMLRAEQMQAAVVREENVDNDALIRLSGEARRLLAGLRKRARPTQTPSLREHLAKRAAELAGATSEAPA
jgi:hypothetical protein